MPMSGCSITSPQAAAVIRRYGPISLTERSRSGRSAKQVGAVQDEAELRELGRLDLDRPEDEPAPGAVDRRADAPGRRPGRSMSRP